MREARDHGPESAAAVAAPGETGGMAFGMVGAGLPVGSGDRASDVSERGVEPFEGRHEDRPAPGVGADRPVVAAGMAEGGPAAEGVGHDLGVGCGPALAEAPDRDRSGPRPRTAFCRVRPGPPPAARSTPPGWASSIPTRPDGGFFPSRRAVPAVILRFIVRAAPCLTPSRRSGSTDRMSFFAVMIGWMAVNQTVSGSLVEWRIVPAVGEVRFLPRLH